MTAAQLRAEPAADRHFREEVGIVTVTENRDEVRVLMFFVCFVTKLSVNIFVTKLIDCE